MANPAEPAEPASGAGTLVVVRTASTSAVAKDLGVSERSVRLYAQAGRIPFSTTPGGHRRFDLDEVHVALGIASRNRAPSLESLRGKRKAIVACARRYGARNVRVFGSVATGEADPTSDVDLLVALDRGRTYADVDALEAALTELLGYDVDVLTEGACHSRFASVLDEAVAL